MGASLSLLVAVHLVASWGQVVDDVDIGSGVVGPVRVGDDVAFGVTVRSDGRDQACEVRTVDGQTGRTLRRARITVARPPGGRHPPPAGVHCRSLTARGGEAWILVQDWNGDVGDILHAVDDRGRRAARAAMPYGTVAVVLSAAGVRFVDVGADAHAVAFHPTTGAGWAARLLGAESAAARRTCIEPSLFDVAVARCDGRGCGASHVLERLCTASSAMELTVYALAGGGAVVASPSTWWGVDAAGALQWQREVSGWTRIAGELEDDELAACGLDVDDHGTGSSWLRVDARTGRAGPPSVLDGAVYEEVNGLAPACATDRRAGALHGALHRVDGVRLFRASGPGTVVVGERWALPAGLAVDSRWRAPGVVAGLVLDARGAPVLLVVVRHDAPLAPLLLGASPASDPRGDRILLVSPDAAALPK